MSSRYATKGRHQAGQGQYVTTYATGASYNGKDAVHSLFQAVVTTRKQGRYCSMQKYHTQH